MRTIQSTNQFSKEDYRDIICRFLSTKKFRIAKSDPDIENTIFTQFNGYEELGEAKARYLAVHGASSAEHFYPLHKKEVRQRVGFFTAFLGALDDQGPRFLDELRRFSQDMLHDTPQIPLLRDYKTLCAEFGDYYISFCADKIAVGVINFASSTALEHEKHDFTSLPDTPNFPHYFRFMTGLVEAYTWFLLPEDIFSPARFDLFIQIVPDLMDYTNAVNDLLSFYKEYFVAGERSNLVCLRAKAEGCGLEKVLNSLCGESEVYAARIKAVASEDKELLQVVNAYLEGYIGFHVSQPRYYLRELSLPV